MAEKGVDRASRPYGGVQRGVEGEKSFHLAWEGVLKEEEKSTKRPQGYHRRELHTKKVSLGKNLLKGKTY